MVHMIEIVRQGKVDFPHMIVSVLLYVKFNCLFNLKMEVQKNGIINIKYFRIKK